MKVIEHGKWVRYTPDKKFLEEKNLPDIKIAFVKRSGKNGKVQGDDWYEYQKTFKNGTLLATAYERPEGFVIGIATYEVRHAFPQDCLLLEITDYKGKDPQKDFGNKIYDPKTKTFADPPPRERGPDPRQMANELEELKAQVAELLAAMKKKK